MISDISIQIGINIRRLRTEKGILQQDLAALCNFEVSTMSRIEAGRSNPTVSTLDKIANALGVPVRELLP